MTGKTVSAHDVMVAQMQAHAAQVKAAIGALPHPHARLFAVHGISLTPGQQVFDSVSGQIATVRSAGQLLHARESEPKPAPAAPPKTITVPGLERVPYVIVELPSGKLVPRHPDEVSAIPGGVVHPHAPGHLEPK